MLMLIDEQNKKGGVLGKKLEAVVVDPASNWPLFAEKARELISQDKVAAVFGCWTSVSRKSVLPVFKELNSDPVLPRAVRGRGKRAQRVLHRRRAEPAGDPGRRLPDERGRRPVKRWVLEGTDYVYPRTTNKILEAYLKHEGGDGRGHHDQLHAVRLLRLADRSRRKIKKFGSAGKKTAVVSTINGDANVPFYKELGNQGIKATDIPVVAFSVGEEELAGLDTKPLRRPSRRLELFQDRSRRRRTRPSSRTGTTSSRTPSAPPTTRWKPTTSASTCG